MFPRHTPPLILYKEKIVPCPHFYIGVSFFYSLSNTHTLFLCTYYIINHDANIITQESRHFIVAASS